MKSLNRLIVLFIGIVSTFSMPLQSMEKHNILSSYINTSTEQQLAPATNNRAQLTISLPQFEQQNRTLLAEDPLKIIKQYLYSGNYNREIKSILDNVYEQLAQEPVDERSAIIFDIDDTIISHHGYRMQAIEEGSNTDANFFAYICKADSPAIPEVLEFYNKVKALGYKIILLTGRSRDYLACTEEVLAKNGYTGYTKLILKSPEEKALFKTAAAFKQHKRQQLVDEGYSIKACIGDQECDLEGQNTGIKIKIPNPLFLNR